jgi:transaldolase
VKSNPLRDLRALGQSVWLDYIRRDLIEGGQLRRLIDEDGLSGMTSNPAIFEQAIAEGQHYDDQILTLTSEGRNAAEIYEAISQQDVRSAADQFRGVYDASQGEDGFVSLEVNPHLANDTAGTVEEARRLWRVLDRPNVMIKVPGTSAGLPAIKQLLSEGLNINVTLLFGLQRYRAVIDAYLEGLEARLEAGKPIRNIASVASFFISRIDGLVDPMLERLMAGHDSARAAAATAAHGRIAIANAKLAYQLYGELFTQQRFKTLEARGARPQRLLWASTSTKNRTYSDVKYVEALIGPHTVDTMPLPTLDAYRDHGEPKVRLTQDIDEARSVIEHLPDLGIDLSAVTAQLETEGVKKFVEPFDKLLASIGSKHAAMAQQAAAASGVRTR